MGWQGILYGRIYVDFSFLTVHKVCTKARLLGERSVRIREVKGSNPSMQHLSSWMTTLPMMLIGMTGILLVIGLLHRRRRRCFCRIHPRASCRVVWKYSLGVMPYSFLKARKKWL